MISIAIFMTLISPFTALIPAAAMLYAVHKNKMLVFLNPLNIGIVLIFGSSLLSGLFNRDKISTIASFGILLYLGLCIYFQNNYTEESKVEKLALKVMLLSLITVAIGISEKIASFFFDMTWISELFWSPTYIPTKAAYRIYSTFGNPNVAGDWFACMFLICIYFIQKSANKKNDDEPKTASTNKHFFNYLYQTLLSNKKRIAYAICATLFIITTLLTGSKGSLIGLEIAILTYAIFTKCKQTRIVLITTFFLVIVMAFTLPVMNHSLNSRAGLWQQCLILSNQKPLLGWGLFGIFNQIGEIHGHNIWITLLTTLGFTGLCIYLSMKLYLMKGIMSLYSKGSTIVPLLAAIQAFIIGHGLVDFTLLLPQTGMLFFTTSAIISGLDQKYNEYPAVDWANLQTAIKPHPSNLTSKSS
ncbi:MAG: hypothetical protein CVU84_15070 [Firmicutes bacterium HGW-Firmicutes-1]|jgi:O-antigen ligase|nr:MAG: hypothetical protein CVU84_15070 [Firmicutes bacterium HGW-Firmicutes-1]